MAKLNCKQILSSVQAKFFTSGFFVYGFQDDDPILRALNQASEQREKAEKEGITGVPIETQPHQNTPPEQGPEKSREGQPKLPERTAEAMTGSKFIEAFNKCKTPEDRQRLILSQAANGAINPECLKPRYYETEINGKKVKVQMYGTLEFGVPGDSVIVCADAYTSQTLADMLGGTLPTADFYRQLYRDASVQKAPFFQGELLEARVNKERAARGLPPLPINIKQADGTLVRSGTAMESGDYMKAHSDAFDEWCKRNGVDKCQIIVGPRKTVFAPDRNDGKIVFGGGLMAKAKVNPQTGEVDYEVSARPIQGIGDHAHSEIFYDYSQGTDIVAGIEVDGVKMSMGQFMQKSNPDKEGRDPDYVAVRQQLFGQHSTLSNRYKCPPWMRQYVDEYNRTAKKSPSNEPVLEPSQVPTPVPVASSEPQAPGTSTESKSASAENPPTAEDQRDPAPSSAPAPASAAGPSGSVASAPPPAARSDSTTSAHSSAARPSGIATTDVPSAGGSKSGGETKAERTPVATSERSAKTIPPPTSEAPGKTAGSDEKPADSVEKQKTVTYFVGDSLSAGFFPILSRSGIDTRRLAYPGAQRHDKNGNLLDTAVGRNTSEMLTQLHEIIKEPGHRGATLFILGGTNDLFGNWPIETITKNLTAIYKLAKQNGMKVISATLPPIGDSALRADSKHSESTLRQRWDDLNDWILKNEGQEGGPDYVIKLHTAMANPNDPYKINPEIRSKDGVHFKNYQPLAKAIQDGLLAFQTKQNPSPEIGSAKQGGEVKTKAEAPITGDSKAKTSAAPKEAVEIEGIEPIDGNTIIMGDSNMAYLDYGDKPGQLKINGNHPGKEKFAKGGQTVPWGLARIRDAQNKNEVDQARNVVILFGSNDIGAKSKTAEQTFTELSQLWASFEGKNLFICTVPPFKGQKDPTSGTSYYSPKRELERQSLNNKIREAAAKNPNLHLIDVDQITRRPTDERIGDTVAYELDPAYDKGDHIHIPPAIMAEKILQPKISEYQKAARRQSATAS